ncbi:MAG: DUF1643 domain-containing protein [Rhodanobacteraceae bacterium]|nr:DUF1643 domain-containing protein [Rhodanobacteraceae bacterium]
MNAQLSLFAPEYPKRGVVMTPGGTYRYRLWEVWKAGPQVAFVMLNPSLATHQKDDPTFRRCRDFAERWGFSGMQIVNLFAFVTPFPKVMRKADDPVGADNGQHVVEVLRHPEVERVVCAWGAGGTMNGAGVAMRKLIVSEGHVPHCLGLTRYGQPLHPGRLAKSLVPVPWLEPGADGRGQAVDSLGAEG